jgi:hypothetical protein
MMRIAPLLLLAGLGTLACAADSHTFAISAGVAYRYDREARSVTDENGDFGWAQDYGYHARLSSGAPSPGLIGWGAIDIDWSRSTGNDDRIDTVGVLYVERIPLGSFRLGLGLGSFYNDVSIDDHRSRHWTIGGTATLSMDLIGPFYIEGGYDLTSITGSETGGIKTDSVFLDLGLKF